MGSLGFWRIAGRRPDRVAVVDADGAQYTAGEVPARSNRIAHALRARGVTAGDAVAMVVPRHGGDQPGRPARMKWPKSVDLIAEMPRDPSGKLHKRRLRDPYWEGQGRNL